RFATGADNVFHHGKWLFARMLTRICTDSREIPNVGVWDISGNGERSAKVFVLASKVFVLASKVFVLASKVFIGAVKGFGESCLHLFISFCCGYLKFTLIAKITRR